MGWTFCRDWHSKTVLVNYLTKPSIGGPDDTNSKEETIAKKVVGRVLYFVREHTRRVDGVRERVLFVCLLESDVRNGMGWGYKDMDESMGPCEDTCPVEFFKFIPEPPNAYAREFRQRCILRAEREKMIIEKLKPGATVKFKEGTTPKEAVVLAVNPREAIVEAPGHTGMTYRIAKRNYRLIEKIT